MKEYLTFAIPLARKAGKIMKENFSLGMKKEWKGDTSPVTATDLEIELMVRAAVKKRFPDHGFVGEENGKTVEKEFMWVCDPVDGTIPFSHGIPTCVFMLALVQRGRPIMSVIYDPFEDRMFTAEKNKGAYLNGKRIHVSKNSNVKKSPFGVLFWRGSKYDLGKTYLECLKCCGVEGSVGSIGYVDMLVACGELEVIVFAGETVWDSAAPDLLVGEAGGKFTDLYGEIIDYRKPVRGHIATNGIVHSEVLRIVKNTLKVSRK